MRRSNILVGSLFIVFGIILGINLLTNVRFEFWPFFILIPGLVFEISFFRAPKKADPGLLVPGGILTVIGLLFIFETITNWKYTAQTWPVYLLAVAVGLFQLYLFGKREKGLLVPVGILSGLFIIFMLGTYDFIQRYFRYAAPAIIILVGLIIILRSRRPVYTPPAVIEHTDEPELVKKNNSESE